MKANIFIAGAGGIGQAAALILAESEFLNVTLYLGDISTSAIQNSTTFIQQGATKPVSIHGVVMTADDSDPSLVDALESCQIILDCLPGSQAPRLARLAKKFGCHYANLTEYVAETQEIQKIAEGADTAFVLQTGLAPGFINILACQLYKEFSRDFGVEVVDEMAMKVGALSMHAPAPHFYAFTWSPIGVATEYLKDAEVVVNFQKQLVPALSRCEEIVIDGEVYEDNFTSGGAADLPDAFAGRVKNLHYKTLRHPKHYAWVESTLQTLQHEDDKIQSLEKIMLDQIASVEDDFVIVYAAVQGKDSQGRLRRKEKAYKILPSRVGNQMLRAIQTTTAAPLCEMAYMMLQGNMKGVILQSQIDSETFLNGPFVKSIYGGY